METVKVWKLDNGEGCNIDCKRETREIDAGMGERASENDRGGES